VLSVFVNCYSPNKQTSLQFALVLCLILYQSRDDAADAHVVTEGVYDYAENVESGSTLSTPTSSHTGDPPFASDGLGETVIHFDQV